MMASTWDPKPSDPCVFRGAVEDDEDPQQAQQPPGVGGSARRGGRGRILRTCVSLLRLRRGTGVLAGRRVRPRVSPVAHRPPSCPPVFSSLDCDCDSRGSCHTVA